MYDWTHTTAQLSDSDADTAVISVGATEQCGPCLPLHIDTLCAEYFAHRWGQVLDAFVLPTLPFNTSEEHTHFRGTVSVTPAALTALLEEVVEGLRRQAFRKQVLTCGHGGSYWSSAFVKHVNHRFDDIVLVNAHVNSGEAWRAALGEAGLAGGNEIHGGLVSKCIAMFLCPQHVRQGSFGADIDPERNQYMDYGVWHRIAPDGCWGRVSGREDPADLREKGRILLETFTALQGARLKHHLAEACRLKGIEADDKCPARRDR